VHLEPVALRDAHHDVAEVEAAGVAVDHHLDRVLVRHAGARGVFGRHVDVALGADHALPQRVAAGRSLEHDARRVRDVTRAADRALEDLPEHRVERLGVSPRPRLA
jgi:hypothetical protein